MTPVLLLILYGLCTWGASLNCPAWARLLYRRYRSPDRTSLFTDTFMLTRTGLTLMSFGVAGLAGVRVYGALVAGVPLAIPTCFGMVFIASMAVAEPFFLAVDSVHAQALGRWSLGWRLYWIGAIAWVLSVAILA